MHKRQKKAGFSFILSLLIHIVILGFLFFSIGYYFENQLPSQKSKENSDKQAVQAVTVDQKQVQTQIARIKAAEQAKKEKEIAFQRRLATLASQAKQQRVTEQQRVSKLQQQQKAIETKTKKEKIAAEKQLARLNQLQAEAQKKLNQLQAQQEKLEQQNEAIQQKLTATKQALEEQPSIAKKEALEKQLRQEKAEAQSLAQQQMMNQVSRYKTLILNAIGKQWIIPQGADPALSCELLIQLSNDGTVLNVQLVKSSGNPTLDQSAITAVLKASPLPMPQSPALLQKFKEIQLTVKPEGLLD